MQTFLLLTETRIAVFANHYLGASSVLWAGFKLSPEDARKTVISARGLEVRSHFAAAHKEPLTTADQLYVDRAAGKAQRQQLRQQALTKYVTNLQAQLAARSCSPGRQRASPRAANTRAEVALHRDALSVSQALAAEAQQQLAHAHSQIQVDMIISQPFPWSSAQIFQPGTGTPTPAVTSYLQMTAFQSQHQVDFAGTGGPN